LDEESLNENELDENHNRNKVTQDITSPRLSFQQLEQFNRQQPSKSPTQNSRPIYHMPTDEGRRPQLSLSQKDAMDDTNQSDASSSSFNLSTDAEDTEYEALKKGGVVPPLNASTLDTSAMSNVSNPTNYATDEDRAIFPALLTDDELTFAEKESLVGARVPLMGVDDDHSRSNILPMSNESADDIRAWTLSPSTQASFKDTVGSASPQFSFNGQSSNSFPNTKKTAGNFSTSPNVTSLGATPRRSFTTPAFADDFADFADFDKISFPSVAVEQKPRKEVLIAPDSHAKRNNRSFLVEADFSIDHLPSASSRRHHHSSASAAHPDSTISDLLAQAKRTSRSKKPSSLSVNSAPTVTAQYLRQHHNLRSFNGEREARAAEKATSVSDIIQNLELTNASRAKATSSRKCSQRSTGEHTDTLSNHSKDGANASIRSSKDRLKDQRRKERDAGGSTRKHRSRSTELDSSDPSDNEASESWLFDEVTGALGPRGVAADLESLSGRSNRSKSSTGNKSHRSHKSHRSSRRRQGRSSSDSVDSRGSKTSRNSRYSHRSTRSYISQMSEQSRSVANDLLRLEMQLAMVGSQENVEEAHVRTGGSVASSVGGASRASRASRTSSATRRASALVRRSKVDVVAPPGKLGIILANKADSKGTVVSGVRTSSVLAEKISPGDRIVAIDGEDVSRMTVSEITTIMARKSDFERILTVLTTPRHLLVDPSPMRSPTATDGSGFGLSRR
jgi:hypothetical protein